MAMDRAKYLVAVLFSGLLSQQVRPEPPTLSNRKGDVQGRVAGTDCYRDPLPAGVLARLGTVRFRHVRIRTLAYSPDEKHIATGGGDGVIRLWDAANGRQVRALRGHPSWVSALAFSPDGRILVSGGPDRSGLRFWDVASGSLISSWSGPRRRVYTVAFARTGKLVASVGLSGLVHCWEAATGKHLFTCAGRPGNVRSASVAFSPDGKLVVAGDSRDGEVRLWTVATGKLLRSWKAHDHEILAVTFSPDGKVLATSDRSALRLWDVATGKVSRSWGTPAVALAFSPDGRIFASANVHSLRLWDPATGKPLCPCVRNSDAFFTVAFAPHGRTVACGGDDGVVSLYDATTGKLKLTDKGHRHEIRGLAFSPDSGVVATTSLDGTLRLWDAATGPLLHVCTGHHGYVSAVAFSPDGKALASWSNDWTVRTWAVATGKQLQVWETPAYWYCYKFLFAPGGKILAAGNNHRTNPCSFQILDVTTGKVIHTVADPHNWSSELKVSSDGRVLAFTASVNELGLWHPGTGKPIHTWVVPERESHPLAISPDGRVFASGGVGNPVIRFWDATNGRAVGICASGNDPPWCAAFSPDGKVLLSGSKRLRLWEVRTGQEIRSWEGHADGINSVAFASDGQTIASAGRDTTVLIWDAFNRLSMITRRRALAPDNLRVLWTRLGGKAKDAYPAIVLLGQMPKASVPFLKHEMHPITPVTAVRLNALIADLDNDLFAARQTAHAQLVNLTELAEPALRRALTGRPSVEQRQRLQDVLKQIADIASSPERLRRLRAITALEWAGTPEARELLRTLAKGAPAARLTREARAALDRMAKRSTPPPK